MEQAEAKFETQTIHVTASIGLAVMQNETDLTLEQLIYRADQALYQSKATGRNRSQSGKRRIIDPMLKPTHLILVALLPTPRDLEIARLLGWYRIRSAPRRRLSRWTIWRFTSPPHLASAAER